MLLGTSHKVPQEAVFNTTSSSNPNLLYICISLVKSCSFHPTAIWKKFLFTLAYLHLPEEGLLMWGFGRCRVLMAQM